MKVAVVGCGAVGSFYGAKLARAGHEMHFLLRSDYEAVRRQGVLIKSPQGDFRIRPKVARRPEQIGPSEVVLIGLKTTASQEYARLLTPLIGKETAILTLQNGLGNEEQLARLFPVESILGGLCFVCLNRVEPGVIHHLAHGQVVIGEHQRWPEPRTHDLAGMFRHAGVPCTVTDNLARAHWEKLTWNIPFNGLGVAGVAGYEAVMSGTLAPARPPGDPQSGAPTALPIWDGKCLSTKTLLEDERWARLARELMIEVIRAAGALGFALSDSLADEQIERTRSMGAYRASTLIDFERGLPLELESLFLEPLRQAKAVGVPVPRLECMCRVLEQLDRTRIRNETESPGRV